MCINLIYMVFLMNLLIIVEVNEFEDGSVNIN